MTSFYRLGQKSWKKFRWFFWKISRHQKDISKLTDLYHCYCLLRYFLKKFLRQTKPPLFLAFFSGFGMCINCTTLVSKCMLRHNSISHFKKDEINPTANIIEENCLPSAKYKSHIFCFGKYLRYIFDFEFGQFSVVLQRL